MHTLRINIGIPRRKVQAIIAAFAIADVLFILGTWALDVYVREVGQPESGIPWFWHHLLRQLSLAPENVVAVWYASLQLLAVAVLAVLCFIVDRRTDASVQVLSYGWLGLAVVFFGFSLDELGSLHERIGSLGTATQPVLGWILLLVFLTSAGGFAVAFAAVHLKKYRLSLALVMCGVALFGTIPFQELAEGNMRALAATTEGWRRPTLFTLLEEGAELIASLCFLAATATYAAAKSPRDWLPITVGLKEVVRAATVLVIMLGGLMIAVQLFTWATFPGDSGRPNNWFAGVVAALAACVSLYLAQGHRRATYYVLALTSAVASVYVGANLYGYLYYETYSVSIERLQACLEIVFMLAILMLGFVVGLFAPTRCSRVAGVAWALLLVGATATTDSRLVPLLTFCSFAVLLPSLPLHMTSSCVHPRALQSHVRPPRSRATREASSR